MEPLLGDANRSTATLALTTLLKIGNESSVDRLVKQITNFMADISDVYKTEVRRRDDVLIVIQILQLIILT
jgi:coatomer subunit gamma